MEGVVGATLAAADGARACARDEVGAPVSIPVHGRGVGSSADVGAARGVVVGPGVRDERGVGEELVVAEDARACARDEVEGPAPVPVLGHEPGLPSAAWS